MLDDKIELLFNTIGCSVTNLKNTSDKNKN